MGMTHEPDRDVPPLAIAVPSDLADLLLAAGCGRKLSFRSVDAIPAIVAGTGLMASVVTLVLQGKEALRATAEMVRSLLSSRDESYRFTYRRGDDWIEVSLSPGTEPEVIEGLLATVARLASRT
jgi:hypothetical protein